MSLSYNLFINTQELAEHIDDEGFVIVDCRFDLKDPEWGYLSYLDGHIPGAYYAHLDLTLSGLITPNSGRHPLPDSGDFFNTLSEWGVTSHTQMIVYDHAGGAFASRLWWMMKYFGHDKVAVLNGGYPVWLEENQPIQSGVIPNRPITEKFAARIQPGKMVVTDEVVINYSNKQYLLIDARSRERFLGLVEPIDPISGHIPGALNRFHGENLNPDLTIKSPAQLKREFTDLLQNYQPEETIVYCGSGVTSCLHILAMEYAGLHGSKLYLGSWSEWIRESTRPIEKRIPLITSAKG